jgi:hypothetical protein
MRLSRLLIATVLVWFAGILPASLQVQAADSRILKVLPHYLDAQGRHTLSPSLYERDAYQALLRKNPSKISGLRFDIHWRADRKASTPATLRMELRTSKHQGTDVIVLETPLPAKRSRGWTPLTLDSDAYRAAGDIQAWHATIREGDKVLAESSSFLW